jgi:hypothetical protein
MVGQHLRQDVNVMGFIVRFRLAVRVFALVQQRRSRSLCHLASTRPCVVTANSMSWTRLRMKVVRRDRYRCRGCDRRGDEVTLEVHRIYPNASDIDGMLALCTNCRELANTFHLSSDHIPDFLRRLWFHLHHPAHGLAPSRIPALDSAVPRPVRQSQENVHSEMSYQALRHSAGG